MADTCEAYRTLIEEGAGGGRALRSHPDACGPCREFRREREALKSLLGGLERVSAPDDFEFRLRARMAARRGAERAPLWRLRPAPGWAAIAFAACLLAAASVYFVTRPAAGDAVAARQVAPAATAPQIPAREDEGLKTDDAGQLTPPPAVVAREQERPRGRAVAAGLVAAERRHAERPRRAVSESTFGARGASVIDGSEGVGAAADEASQTIRLRTSPETLRVVLRDERGASHVLPMRSVSFGAQAPVGRGVRAERASDTDRGGVW